MLARFNDKDGRETWINPIHVKVVRDYKGMLGGKKGSEVWFGFSNTSEAIYILEPPTEVAAILDAAMPSNFAVSLDDEDQDTSPPAKHA